MDEQRSYSSPNIRDIAGAWMLCVVIAALLLGLAITTGGGLPPAAAMATDALPCTSDLGFGCRSFVETGSKNVGPVAGLHRLKVPTPHPGDRPHG
jgi:hypothetical protein